VSHIASGTEISIKQKYHRVPASTLFTGSGNVLLLALPKSQNVHEKFTVYTRHFESIQDIEAATTAQLNKLTKVDF